MKNPPHINLLLRTIKNLQEVLREDWMMHLLLNSTEQLNGRELEDIDRGLRAIHRLKDAVIENEMRQLQLHSLIEPKLLKDENE